LIMALGQIVMGHPFWGVWLSVGLMCAAICWMLQGWLPPGWALLGGLLAVIRLGTFCYWASSYFGGAVAATGGALVLGALPRIKQSQRVRDALLMGLGFAIVANSRPYEGVFLGLPVAIALAAWVFGKKRPDAPPAIAGASAFWGARASSPHRAGAGWKPALRGRDSMKRVVAPLFLVLFLTGCGMGYYFWRTTGSPWEPPHFLNAYIYNHPYFPWQASRPEPLYHHAVMRDFYRNNVMGTYLESRSIIGLAKMGLTKLLELWSFFLGPALTVPLLLALASLPYGFSWKDISGETRLLLLACGAVTAASMLPITFLPHFLAPVACTILALVLHALRRIRSQEWRGQPTGLFVSRAVPLLCMLMLALRVGAKPLHLPEPDRWLAPAAFPTWCTLAPTNLERAATLAELEQHPGRQLAIVRYGPRHDVLYHEWVYNEADIDHAKVVWARDMGPAQNKELIDYFRDRHVWLVEADDTPPKVLPYGASP